MRRKTLAAVASCLIALSATPAHAEPAGSPEPPSGAAFVQPGERNSVSIEIPTAPPAAPATPPRSGTPAPATPRLAPDDPPPPPTREMCLAEPDAQTRPGDLGGWYPNRYGWCAYGEFRAPGTDARTGQVVAEFSADFVVLGYGNNGARQFDYLVYLEDIKTSGTGVNWTLATMEASFTGCTTAMTCPVTTRLAPIPAWQASNVFAVTFTSPEVTGGGVQLVNSTIRLDLRFATPTQPEWIWSNGATVGESPVRYDSASYVGRARGAVFPAYPLVFSVDLRLANQDESARHIMHALEQPHLTFPSWLGKSVPNELTRMYNPTRKDANREHSRTECLRFYGPWNGDLDNCDEYPFASTYEGSKSGPEDYGWGDRYSVRLIDATDNQYVGNDLLEVAFYRALRVLDREKFRVTVLR